MKVVRLASAVALTLLLCLVASQPALAKTAPGLQVFPLWNYPVQTPSGSSNGSLTLTNNTTKDQQVTMSTELFQTKNEDYDYQFSPGGETKWVNFDDPQITLVPKEVKVVKYTIDAPADASPGGHYIAIIASLSPVGNANDVIEIRRVASLVYLEISGHIVKHSTLANFSLPWITTHRTVPVEVHIGNQGTSHTRARALITSTGWPQNHVQELKQLEGLVLPSTVRKLADNIELPSSPGIYKVTAEYAPTQGGVTRLGHIVIYAPWWFTITVLVGLILGTSYFLRWFLPHAKRAKHHAKRLIRRRHTKD